MFDPAQVSAARRSPARGKTLKNTNSRPRFRALRRLRDELEQEFSLALPQLSMGMSGDFEVAIEEGATYVRVGTALFGRRTAGAWKPEHSADSDSYFLQP